MYGKGGGMPMMMQMPWPGSFQQNWGKGQQAPQNDSLYGRPLKPYMLADCREIQKNQHNNKIPITDTNAEFCVFAIDPSQKGTQDLAQ